MQPQPQTSESKPALIIILVVFIILIALGLAVFQITAPRSGPLLMTPAATYDKTLVAGGWQVEIVAITKDVPWDDIRVCLGNGTDIVLSDCAQWETRTGDLDGGSMITSTYAAEPLGTLSVNLTVTDRSGDGKVGGTDYFTVTANPAFSSATNYTAFLVFEPTLERIGYGITFTG
jgi:hypothetical protein